MLKTNAHAQPNWHWQNSNRTKLWSLAQLHSRVGGLLNHLCTSDSEDKSFKWTHYFLVWRTDIVSHQRISNGKFSALSVQVLDNHFKKQIKEKVILVKLNRWTLHKPGVTVRLLEETRKSVGFCWIYTIFINLSCISWFFHVSNYFNSHSHNTKIKLWATDCI